MPRPRVPDALVDTATACPTPALLYDAQSITQAVASLREDLQPLPSARVAFAVKANRFADVLRHLAALDVGADVASRAEWCAAAAVDMSPITATSPALTPDDIVTLTRGGVEVDLDSESQLRGALARGLRGRVGLRIRVPVSPADRRGSGVEWSRFGVDPASRTLHGLLADAPVTVVRLHVHAGEIQTAVRARALASALASCMEHFGHVTEVNLGGGLTSLYARPAEARRAWREVGDVFAALPSPPKVVVEPGMFLTVMSGYLVTSVLAVDQHPSGGRYATVDASAWNLLTWTRPHLSDVVRTTGDGPLGAEVPHVLVGPTCYEEDRLADVVCPALQVGDRVLLGAVGAYVSSMARTMHALAPPHESLIVTDATAAPHPAETEVRCPIRT